jgi:hypothetical protein
MTGDPGMPVRAPHVEGIGVFKVFVNIFTGQAQRIFSFFPGPVDYFVVHVCKVLDIEDIVAPVSQVPPDGVKEDQRPGIAQVDVVVGGGTANIHINFAWFPRLESFLPPGQGIIYLHAF